MEEEGSVTGGDSGLRDHSISGLPLSLEHGNYMDHGLRPRVCMVSRKSGNLPDNSEVGPFPINFSYVTVPSEFGT